MRKCLLSVVVLLLKIPWTAGISQCPQSCDCQPDPVLPSSLSISCSYDTSIPERLALPANTRTVHLSCTTPIRRLLPADFISGTSTLHSFSVTNCDVGASIFKAISKVRNLQLEKISSTELHLADDDFGGLSKLEKLVIVSSHLRTLPSNIFCSLQHLMVLNVSTNSFTQLDFSTDCKSKLIIADFSYNDFENFDTHTLNFLPSVRQLFLMYSKIKNFETDAFTQLPLLQQLDLEGNKLTTLPTLPENLVHLSLADNQFAQIPPTVLTLPKIVSLNVSGNSVALHGNESLLSKELEVLDLSGNRLAQLPVTLLAANSTSLTSLYLENNRIAELESGQLNAFTNLRSLHLGGNQLRHLRVGVFDGVKGIQKLVLKNNSIVGIESGVFKDMEIAELDISTNQLTEAPLALGGLSKLTDLDLSQNKISRLFLTIFNNCPQLREIDLSENELHTVPRFVFNDCQKLIRLDLSKNKISVIENDAFGKVPMLQRIDVSQNRLRSLEGIHGASSLQMLNASGNHIEVMQWDTLPDSLEYLFAENNRITLLGAAQHSRVRFAFLRDNHIEQIASDQIPGSIEELDLSMNRIRIIANDTLRSKKELRDITLTSNLLETIPLEAVERDTADHPLRITLRGNPLRCSCEMEWLRKSSSSLFYLLEANETRCIHAVDGRLLPMDSVASSELLCDYQRVCEPGCICCQFGSCDCRSVCPSGCSCYRDASFLTNIIHCNASASQDRVFSPSELPMSATHVSLNGVSLPVLRAHAFLGRHKLITLSINSSGVREVQPMAFNTLPKLESLDLSFNEISNLSADIFHKTSEIRHLSLAHNRLTTLDDQFIKKLPKLEKIALQNNLFEDIPQSFEELGVSSISLSANPFRCDCHRRFRAPHWIYDMKDKVIDYPRVLCEENVTRAFRENDTTALSGNMPNFGDDMYKIPVDDFIRELNRTLCVPQEHGFFGPPTTSAIIFVIATAMVGILFVGVILICVAWQRSQGGQKHYKAASSLNCSTATGSSPLPLSLVAYDAFVSYAKTDEMLVEAQICKPLEDDDYHLCLLHRDNADNSTMVHSIRDDLIRQMDCAACLILVITRDFVRNEWSMVQIKTSHLLFARNRQKRVIAVLGSDIDVNRLDDDLGGMLRQSERIFMHDHLFWNLLRSKLPLPPTTALPRSTSNTTSQVYSDLYIPVPSEIV